MNSTCLKRWSFEVQPYGHARWSNGSWCIRAQCPTWKKPSFLQRKNLSADQWSDASCFGYCSIMLRGECMLAAPDQHIHRNPGQQGLFDGGLWTCRWSVGTQQRYGGRRFSLCATKSTWWPSWLERWYETLWKKTQLKTCDVLKRFAVVTCSGNDLDVNSVENTQRPRST